MEYTIVRQPFAVDAINTELDARSRIITESDIWNIQNPYVGQYVYCLDNGATYIITELKEESVGGIINIPDKLVADYKKLTAAINYRGEYSEEETPIDPEDGDWYRNTTEGVSYMYQAGTWNVLAKDGATGAKGDPGKDGEAGIAGLGIMVKGVLLDEEQLPPAAESAIGDAYIVNGILWVFGAEGVWYNAGPFRGEAGTSSYVDIRYSNDIQNKLFTDNNGLTIGVYIGIRVSQETVTTSPSAFDNYQWSELAGTSVEMVYKHVAKTEVPRTPTGTLEEVIAAGWTKDIDAATDNQYTWISTAESKSGTIITDWTTPLRITGKDGQKGLDGTDVKFVFQRSNSNTIKPSYDTVPNQDENYTMASLGWVDDALGVTKDLKYEWMSVRYKRNDQWTGYSVPVVWASFGEDGTDGGGVEYIYYRTETNDLGDVPYKPEEWASAEGYNDYDYYPESDGWTDNPTGTDSKYTCEWVSSRRAKPGDDGKLVWQQFSSPALWAKYAKDGTSALLVSLSNDNAYIICTAKGEEVNPDNRPTTNVSVYVGSSDYTDLSEITASCDTEGITPTVNGNLISFGISKGTLITDKIIIDITAKLSIGEIEYEGGKKFVIQPMNNPDFTYYELKLNTLIIRKAKDGNEYPQRVHAEAIKFTADGRTPVTSLADEGLTIVYDLDDSGVSNVYPTNGIDSGRVQDTVIFYLKDTSGNTLDYESVEVVVDGVDGTSITLDDAVETKAELLLITNAEIGKVIFCQEDGHLYAWDGVRWNDCGKIEGPQGLNAYVHIKYANSLDASGNGVFTANEGEIPGKYIGVYLDNVLADSKDPADYKWSKIEGDPGANGANGINGSRTVFIYKNSATEPQVPTSTNCVNPTDGWELYSTTPSAGEYTWMTTGIALDGVNDTTVDGNGWVTPPAKITGEKGEAGVDGESTEYFYCLTDYYPSLNVAPKLPSYDIDSEEYQSNNWLPDAAITNWTDDPQGIDELNPTEWMCYRTKKDNRWGVLQGPIAWAVYGHKGLDGAGIEYVFQQSFVEKKPETPVTDGVMEEEVPEGWFDEPKGVSAEMPYEWVSIRRNINGEWQPWSAPSLWAAYGLPGTPGKDGEDGKDGENGVGAFYIDLDEDSILIPCAPDGSLIDGNHVGSSTSDPNLFDESWYNDFKVMFGAEDVTEDCTVTVSKSDLLGNVLYNSLYISGFSSTDVKVGTATLTATYSSGGKTFTTKTTFTATKVLSGADGTFTFYLVKPEALLVTARVDVDSKTYDSLTPTTLTIEVTKHTETGVETFDKVPDGCKMIVDLYTTGLITGGAATRINTTEFAAGESVTLNTTNAIRYIIEGALPVHYDVKLISTDADATVHDYEKIAFVYSLKSPGATLPDWVTEWTGTEAQFNGENVLAVRAYFGDAPAQTSTYTGVLMGSGIAKVKNLPFDGYVQGGDLFSGILAVKGFVSSEAFVNEFANVTFALDSKTGDAYFKGEVHATSGEFTGKVCATSGEFNGTVYATNGKFTGEIEATSGKFENGTITNSEIQGLTVNDPNGNYKVTIGGVQTDDAAISIASVLFSADDAIGYKVIFNATTGGIEYEKHGVFYDLDIDSDRSIETLDLTTSPSRGYVKNILDSVLSDDELDLGITIYGDHPTKGKIELPSRRAEVKQNGNVYTIRFNSKVYYTLPIVQVGNNNDGKTGVIRVKNLQASEGGYYSQFTLSGDAIEARFSQSTYFGDDYGEPSSIGYDKVVKITPFGITCNNFLKNSGGMHNYEYGAMYIDSEGYVRVSNGDNQGGHL